MVRLSSKAKRGRCAARSLASACVLLMATSCVRVGWSRAQFSHVIPESEHAQIVVGESSLDACLKTLGAPLYVWEADQARTVLVWGWGEEKGWGVNVSIPLAQEFSATVDYEDTARNLQGLVLTFDADNLLLYKREGALANLPNGTAPDWVSAVQEG